MREAKAINVAGMATSNVIRKPRMPRNVNIVFIVGAVALSCTRIIKREVQLVLQPTAYSIL
jgi:hypothetical protein